MLRRKKNGLSFPLVSPHFQICSIANKYTRGDRGFLPVSFCYTYGLGVGCFRTGIEEQCHFKKVSRVILKAAGKRANQAILVVGQRA